MATPNEDPGRIDAVARAVFKVATTTVTGRIALARIAGAIDPEWLPHATPAGVWRELELARQRASDPIPFETVELTLGAAWDAAPTDELDSLDPQPVAVTPTSQVHRGELDGEAVAVKVLRPGISASVRQDLALLDAALVPLYRALPRVDLAGLMAELRERALDELDLEHEAGSQRRFSRALRNHPHLTVPAPLTRLCHEEVLVSEWVDGRPFRRAADPDLAAARLIGFVLGGLRFGLMHCDPDPDDVLELEDGRLAILDFGATATIEADRAEAVAALVQALIDEDGEAFGSALAALAVTSADRGPSALALVQQALGDLAGPHPTRLDARAVIDLEQRFQTIPPDPARTLAEALAFPPDALWPARGLALLFGSIARVGATGTWRDLSLAALRDGWDARI
jgi:predicted unusual protein kinase regulating ubiquinone biosynthesis (AarF/ABC1/UbiB family)